MSDYFISTWRSLFNHISFELDLVILLKDICRVKNLKNILKIHINIKYINVM